MNLYTFERDAETLHPITLTRPVHRITVGCETLGDMLARMAGGVPIRHRVREALVGVTADAMAADRRPGGTGLWVNAALAPTVENEAKLRRWIDAGRGAWRTGDTLVAAWCDDPADVTDDEPVDAAMLRRPHDVVRLNLDGLSRSLTARIERGGVEEIQPGVFAAEDVAVGPHVVFDTGDGPVVLERGVSVGPLSYFAGPVWIGPDTKIIEHASIKDAVSIGSTCKIGGEVEASVVEAYTNKQHHGFLGHSYLGSWINLGAGTSNSDLKNTYGPISIDYGEGPEPSGMTFFGCVLGDYAKSAINTSIYTGKVIGTGAMLFDTVATDVPAFCSTPIAAMNRGRREVPASLVKKVQSRMFARRGVDVRSADAELIDAAFHQTASRRSTYLSEG